MFDPRVQRDFINRARGIHCHPEFDRLPFVLMDWFYGYLLHEVDQQVYKHSPRFLTPTFIQDLINTYFPTMRGDGHTFSENAINAVVQFFNLRLTEKLERQSHQRKPRSPHCNPTFTECPALDRIRKIFGGELLTLKIKENEQLKVWL